VCVAECDLRFESIAAFADDVGVRVAAQELAEGAAGEGFVVDDEGADPAVGGWHGRWPVGDLVARQRNRGYDTRAGGCWGDRELRVWAVHPGEA